MNPEHKKNTRKSLFWILCSLGLFAILSSTLSKNPVLNPFAAALGTPEGFWKGIVGSASTIPGILVSLPAASLSDVFGRRRMLLISAFVFASAPFLYLFITVWWQLILVRFYHGFATAIFVPVAEASVAEHFPTKRGERISLFSSATAIGRAIAPFLGGYILYATNYSYHTLYLAVAMAGVTTLVTALLFLIEVKTSATQSHSSKEALATMFTGWNFISRNAGVLVVSFVQASQYYAFGTVEYFLVEYLKQVAGFDAFLIGAIMGSQIVILIIAKPFMGRLSDKIGRRAPIIIGCILSAIPLFAIPIAFNLFFFLLLSLVYGFGFATVTASTPALVCELLPKELTGTSMGFLDTVMDIGQTLGPIISGIILASFLSYSGVFSSLGILLLLAAISFALSKVPKQDK